MTGAGGFVGRNIVRCLVDNRQEVVALYRSIRNAPLVNASRNYRFQQIQADLREPLEIDGSFDMIIHAAGRTPRTGGAVAQYIEENVIATRQLLDFAQHAGVGAIAYLSSIDVYGNVRVKEVDESTERINPNVYGLTKFLGEQLLADADTYISSLTIRLPGVVGPGAKGPWLSRIVRAAKAGDDIIVRNSSALFNNVVHIDDLYRVLIAMVKRPRAGANVVTLSATNPLPIGSVVDIILKMTGSSSRVMEKRSESSSFVISCAKVMSDYCYRARSTEVVVRSYTKENCE